MRVAFVGQSTFFEACVPDWPDSCFLEFRGSADPDPLLRELRDFAPDVIVVFRPEVIPAGVLQELEAVKLGFLSEPIPRTGAGAVDHEDLSQRLWELEQVDARQFDRVVAFDPLITDAADAVLPIWRSVPLPVADRYYADVPQWADGPPRPIFVGRSTPHREQLLTPAKHRFDLLHLAFGVGADELERALRMHDVGINIHNNPYPSFENRVCLHLAAGHLVITERLSPTHGIEHGVDVLEISTAEEIVSILEALHRAPSAFQTVRIRGRRKAEQFRASRVWTRLLADLESEMSAAA